VGPSRPLTVQNSSEVKELHSRLSFEYLPLKRWRSLLSTWVHVETIWIGFESNTPVLEAIEERFQADKKGFCLPSLQELAMDFTRPEHLD